MSQASEDSKPRPSKRAADRVEGLSSEGFRLAIVASRFNDEFVGRLLEGALSTLEGTGTERRDVRVVRVPGAFELPLAARRLAESDQFDAIVALGCVIRGETAHFEHISRAATDGLSRVALESGVPIGFGLLTADTPEQALARSGGAKGNAGSDAAAAAVEMASSLRSLRGS